MHPAEFCEDYITASLLLIFFFNSALALLLGIPYSEQKHKRVLDMDQPIFGQGEVAQIITSSMIIVITFCLFLGETRVVPCGRSRMSKVVAFIMLAALSMLGACCLTIFGGENEYCESDTSQNIKRCYRRPDVDLPLAWFSTAIAFTGVVASFVLYLRDSATYTLPPKDAGWPRRTRRDSLELVEVPRSSHRNGSERQEEAPAYRPPPPYRPSTPLTSYALPSIPLRKREMNKLGLTVVTNIPPYFEFGFHSLEIEALEV